jgi:acetyltransferase
MPTKTSAKAPASPNAQLPNFGQHPSRSKLSHIETVKGVGKLQLRPIRPDDEQKMIRFHERLSEENVYMRYFEYLGLDRRTTHERLVHVCTNTPESFALVAEHMPEAGQPAEIMAVGRLTRTPEPSTASFDTLIADEAHEETIRHILLKHLVAVARVFGFHALMGELLVADHDTSNLCRKLGFSLKTLPKDGLVRVTINL